MRTWNILRCILSLKFPTKESSKFGANLEFHQVLISLKILSELCYLKVKITFQSDKGEFLLFCWARGKPGQFPQEENFHKSFMTNDSIIRIAKSFRASAPMADCLEYWRCTDWNLLFFALFRLPLKGEFLDKGMSTEGNFATEADYRIKVEDSLLQIFAFS